MREESLRCWDPGMRRGWAGGYTRPHAWAVLVGYTKGRVRGISGFTPAPCLDWVANASVRRVWVSENPPSPLALARPRSRSGDLALPGQRAVACALRARAGGFTRGLR
jgi:hypothetical protein